MGSFPEESPRSRRRLAPANPALPTAGVRRERRRPRRCLVPWVCLRWSATVGGFPRRHAAAGRRRFSPAAAEGLVAVTFGRRCTLFHAPRPSPPLGNAAASGAHAETLVTLEPRRRVRLPKEAMSEAAHHTETP